MPLLNTSSTKSNNNNTKAKTAAAGSLIKNIRRSVTGKGHHVDGPFGPKPMVYVDSTATGRPLSFIENYLRDHVHPFYANTHTEASATGRQTNSYREKARDMIRDAVHAPVDEYVVLFVGSGSTGAIDRMARILGLDPGRAPTWSHLPQEQRPVVFIGPYEHHSNELPWRESATDVVVIPLDGCGKINLAVLDSKLAQYEHRPLKVASFSAASNVTGIRSDTATITKRLHQHGFLSLWDFAAAAPHVNIDVKGHDLDAIFISTHKFVGGPETPGLLVARKSLFSNKIPVVPGGGTVLFVQPHSHKYLDDIEQREEGGTPAILGSIRAGLVVQLHSTVGADLVEARETNMLEYAFQSWAKNPHIVILGNTDPSQRVSIVSFLIKTSLPGRVLHHNFVVALLNDLFGIQCRGGCSCAGPYGHYLLNIGKDQSDEFTDLLEKTGKSVIKPGWSRIAFSYYFDSEMVKYVVDAIHFVANEGYKLLSWYNVNQDSGTFTHVEEPSLAQPKLLWNLSDIGSFKLQQHPRTVKAATKLDGLVAKTKRMLDTIGTGPIETIYLEESLEKLRWFALPQDFADESSCCCSKASSVNITPSLKRSQPKKYFGSLSKRFLRQHTARMGEVSEEW